jgi:hypothetical protein
MTRATRVLPFVLLAVATNPQAGGAVPGSEAHRITIDWPSPGFRDLQSALDAAPDGAVIRIKEGTFEVRSPLFVRAKRLTLRGAGSGRDKRGRVTLLVGPKPNPVVDDRGAIVLPADTVEGLWNFVAADARIEDMSLTGFDAGVVTRPDAGGNSGPTEIRNVVITDTGRGILSLSSGDLRVRDCTVMHTRWNGLSVAPKLRAAPLAQVFVEQFKLIDAAGAGIYFEHALIAIDHATVLGPHHGGIVGFASSSFITNSDVLGSQEAGILIDAGWTDIHDNTILGTTPETPFDVFGDGIVLASESQLPLVATLSKNLIQSSSRAGVSVFGASASLKNNTIFCSAFDLDGEVGGGMPYAFHDLGGNLCGCGIMGACKASSSVLSPPPPVGGLE